VLDLLREIVNAIKVIKKGKAAGTDNIPAEVLKVDPYILFYFILLPLFQDIWQTETFPTEWKEGIIVKVPKKGDLSQCRNRRGVTLLAVISKSLIKSYWNGSRTHCRWAFGRNRLDYVKIGNVSTRLTP